MLVLLRLEKSQINNLKRMKKYFIENIVIIINILNTINENMLN